MDLHPVLLTIIQRLALGFLTLFLVSVVIFSALEFLPGDFSTGSRRCCRAISALPSPGGPLLA